MKEEKLQKEKVATKKKTASNAVIILLLAVIVVSAVIGMYAWAKYTSSANGEARGTSSKVAFRVTRR